jgi:hypothetical protein
VAPARRLSIGREQANENLHLRERIARFVGSRRTTARGAVGAGDPA